MTMDDELFFAWLDGELDPLTAAKVAAEVAADPELAHKAAAHRAMQARLRGAFDTVAPPPMADKVVDLASARSERAARRVLPSMAQYAAMAATLVLGLATGSMIGGGSSAPDPRQPDYLVASAELEQALDMRLASAPAASGPRIGLTFRDQAGSICRTFTDGAAEGLACREDIGWRIRGVVQGADEPTGEFRMAAGSDPALAMLIDTTIAGEPFDADAEREALKAGWR